MAKQRTTKKKETKTYTEVIAWIAESNIYSSDRLTPLCDTVAFIYGKTKEGVRTSVTVKRLQIETLKGLDHE